MTVTTTANSITYAGNGTTTAYSFPYIFFAPTDLVVTLIDTATNVAVMPPSVLNGGATYDYTVTGDITGGEYASGATVTFNTAPLGSHTVLLVRAVPATQTVTLIDNTKFPADTINTEFDKLTILAQQSAFLTSTALQIPSSEVGLIVTAVPAASRANRLLVWDALGNLTTIDPATLIGGAVPAGPASGDLAGTYPGPSIKASVGLTGSPTAPTPTAGDNDTSIATTAFVNTAISAAGGQIIGDTTLVAPAASMNFFALPARTIELSFYCVPTAPPATLGLRVATGSTVEAGLVYNTQRHYATTATPGADSQLLQGSYMISSGVTATGVFGKVHLLGSALGVFGGQGFGQVLNYPSTLLNLGLFGPNANGFQLVFTTGNIAAGSYCRVIGWP